MLVLAQQQRLMGNGQVDELLVVGLHAVLLGKNQHVLSMQKGC